VEYRWHLKIELLAALRASRSARAYNAGMARGRHQACWISGVAGILDEGVTARSPAGGALTRGRWCASTGVSHCVARHLLCCWRVLKAPRIAHSLCLLRAAVLARWQANRDAHRVAGAAYRGGMASEATC
jgi:hypothetical protein